MHSAQKGTDTLDETNSLTGCEPNAYDFKETYVESYTELLTSPPFSKQGFPEDAEYDDAALEDLLREAHRVHVRHSQREDLSVGQSSSVSEEYESLHERTGRPVVMGQSIVLSAIKTDFSLESDDPANQNFLFQQYEKRIEKLSQQDKLSKFCMDAGFLSVVENGQYFMTNDTGDLTQFNTVACREYTLPRKEATSQPKGWIQGKYQNWTRVGSYNQLLAR